MTKEHQLFKLSQKVLFYNRTDKTFLIVKDANPESEVCKKYGVWELPGGRVDKGEQPEKALIRELKEELGDEVQYQLGATVSRYFYSLSDVKRAGIVYLGMYEKGEIKLSAEHSEYVWSTVEEIEKLSEEHDWLKEVIRDAVRFLVNESYLSDLKRLQADFENYKKRQAESQKELGGYLIEKLVLDIVPVLDNFRAATSHVPPEQKDSPWVTGIQYIEKQLETVLTENGVTMIDATPGELFDPSLHEAVGTEGTEEESSEQHKIAKVLQKGYKVGTKVVRPARVSVS